MTEWKPKLDNGSVVTTMNRKIFAVGDSHSRRCFENHDRIADSRVLVGYNKLDGKTAYNLRRHEKKLLRILEPLREKELIFCFGEVDVRLHIKYKHQQLGISIDQLIESEFAASNGAGFIGIQACTPTTWISACRGQVEFHQFASMEIQSRRVGRGARHNQFVSVDEQITLRSEAANCLGVVRLLAKQVAQAIVPP